MPFSRIIKREFEVAFSRRAQPLWLRISKYIVLGAAAYYFWGNEYFWAGVAAVLAMGLTLHFWVRHKTAGWTKSYGLWKYDGGGVR